MNALPPTQQTRFLRMLDRNAEIFTFQTFADHPDKKDNPELIEVIHCAVDDPRLQQLNAAGAGIYVSVNETTIGKRRTKDNIRRVRTVFHEDDGDRAGEFPIEPSFTVQTSPGHFHRYWLIADDWPADDDGHRDFRGVMERMIADYGSDKNAKTSAGFYVCPVLPITSGVMRSRSESRACTRSCVVIHAMKSCERFRRFSAKGGRRPSANAQRRRLRREARTKANESAHATPAIYQCRRSRCLVPSRHGAAK
jgi:hypothetical protein